MKHEDLEGMPFGKLLVSKYAGVDKHRGALWECICDCGNIIIVRAKHLKTGRQVSCGCLKKQRRDNENTNYKHGRCVGGKNTKEYNAYVSARNRCNNPNNEDWKHYGGRGIQFRFNSFLEFQNCLGECPLGLELDRPNNDGHYEAGNVRWTTRSEQCKNQRRWLNKA